MVQVGWGTGLLTACDDAFHVHTCLFGHHAQHRKYDKASKGAGYGICQADDVCIPATRCSITFSHSSGTARGEETAASS